jgi:hypothetical protein
MNGLDVAKAVDAACGAMVTFLKASGPLYRPSDQGAIWVYILDGKEPLGFKMFPAVPANSMSVEDPPSTPVAPTPTPTTGGT